MQKLIVGKNVSISKLHFSKINITVLLGKKMLLGNWPLVLAYIFVSPNSFPFIELFLFLFIDIWSLYFQSNVIFHFCLLFIHSRDIYWTSTMPQAFFLGISFPQTHYALSQLWICLFYQNIFLYVLWDTSAHLSITSTDVTSIVFFIALVYNYDPQF